MATVSLYTTAQTGRAILNTLTARRRKKTKAIPAPWTSAAPTPSPPRH